MSNLSNYSIEDLENNELARKQVMIDQLREWSALHEKIQDHYIQIFNETKSQRMGMYKYMATIAGGAAALAPQLIPNVNHINLFYLGITFLCLTVIVAITYSLSTLEIDGGIQFDEWKKQNEMIYWMCKPKIDFLKGDDFSFEAFKSAMANIKEGLPTEDPKPPEEKSWLKQLDYSSEFVIFFIVSGLSMLVLSLVEFELSKVDIVLYLAFVFIVINIISAQPIKVFTYLGLPIDLFKHFISFLLKKMSK